MYHGIILDLEFNDPAFPTTFSIFAQRKSTDNPWLLFGIAVPDADLEMQIKRIQAALKSDAPYYAHLYNDEALIVIFKNQVFRVTPHIASWGPILEYGRKLAIPEEQLDFWPNRFQDERHYFKPEDFLKE